MKMKCVNVEKLLISKWFILLVNLAFFVLMAWLLPIHFEENDDVAMCMIANGTLSGNPDGHLIFINALYGWMIAGLYMLTQSIEWYTLVFCVLHVLALTIIVCLVIRERKIQPIVRAAFLVFIYMMESRIIMAFQFTTTAGLLCFSGCLSLFQPTKKWWVVGIAAVFFASLIRFHVVGLVGILCFPLFLMRFVKDKRYLLWIITVVGLVLVGKAADGLFYRSEAWTNYKAYNVVRSKLQDSPKTAVNEYSLPDGVTIEDFELFRSFRGDPGIMTLPRLQLLEQQFKKKMSFRQALNNLYQIKHYWIPVFLLMIGFILCIVLNCRNIDSGSMKERMSCYMPIIAIALFLILLSYLCVTTEMRSRSRVFICMLFPMSFQLMKYYGCANDKKSIWSEMTIIFVFIGLLGYYSFENRKVHRRVLSNQREFVTYELPLIKNHVGVLYLPPPECNIENTNPFEISDLNIRITGLGWMTCSPFNKGILESYLDFVDSDILIFSINEQPPIDIEKAIGRNYGVKSKFVKMDYNEKYALYAIKSE